MSDYTTSKPIEIFGKMRAFRALSGVVINAAQRSDTYVSGGGSNSSVAGYGGGNVSIGSTVVVTSDIWIKGKSGEEYRLRFNKDIPVRKDNIVHAVEIIETLDQTETKTYFDENTGKFITHTTNKNNVVSISDGYLLLYNSTTNEWFYTGKLNRHITSTPRPPIFKKLARAFGLLGIAIGLIYASMAAHQVRYGDASWYFYPLFGTVGYFLGNILGWVIALIISPQTPDPYKVINAKFEGFASELDKISFSLTPLLDAANAAKSSPISSAARYCTQCGTEALETATFCGSCGTRLTVQAIQ